MNPQDKLGIGLLVFLVVFFVAFLWVPKRVYEVYFSSFRSTTRRAAIGTLAVVVFALAIPYFYEILVGLDNRMLARVIDLVISVAVYGVVIDVVRFLALTYWAPALMRRRRRSS